jgi:hypothetical protein
LVFSKAAVQRRNSTAAEQRREQPGTIHHWIYLVGAQQKRLSDQPERFDGLHIIDQQVVLSWLLDRQINGLGPLEDLIDEDRRAPTDVVDVRAI